MTARERQGFKGPVREVRIERQLEKGPYIVESRFHSDGRLAATTQTSPDGSEYRQEYTYGDDGEMIDPLRNVQILRNPDGSRREIERIPVEKNFGWGRIEGLEKTGGMAFPTREASQVEVQYDGRGVPAEIVFTYDSGEVASRIVFRSDANGNILEDLVYSGDRPAAPLPPEVLESLPEEDKQRFAPFLIAGSLEVRTTYKYDDAGHPIERVTYLGNEPPERTVWTYNEHGDKATATEPLGWPVRFEYEYGEHGNWTREVVTHGMGSDETIRKFVYYD